MIGKEFRVRDIELLDDEYSTIASTTSVEEAAKKMKELGIPDLVVLDKESKVLGVVDDFDIVQNVVAEGLDPKTTNIISVMYTITPVTLDTPVTEVFKRLQELNVSVVPVVENDKLLGVVTIQDLWGYIPDENKDEIGLIAVSNPKFAEFWLVNVLSIVALFLGFLLPLIGVYGFLKSPLLGYPGLTGTFYLFEARGARVFVSYFDLITGENGMLWLLLALLGFVVLIVGIVACVSLVYSSYSNLKGVRTSEIVQKWIPFGAIIILIVEWIAFGSIWLLGPLRAAGTAVTIDFLGLIMSVISIILFIVAIFRAQVFRQKEEAGASTSGVSE